MANQHTAKSTSQKAASKGAAQPADRQPKTNGQASQQQGGEPLIEFTFEGRSYSLSPGDLNAIEARDYREKVGERLANTLSRGDFDIDVLATLMWLVDRRTDPHLAWEDVASQVTYAKLDRFEPSGEASEDPSDSAGSS